MDGQTTFYDPRQEREAARKRKMAEMLVERGNKEFKNETAGGMTVARSPWEFASRGLDKAVGEYDLAQADEQEAGIEQRRQQMMQEALMKMRDDPTAAATVLGQDPRTAEMAMKLIQGEMEYERKKARWEQEDALTRERYKTLGGGGSVPAAIQIGNKMFELEQIMNNPNLPESERFLAERQYNLYGQAAKTYGFDRGLNVNGVQGYESVFQPAPQQFNIGGVAGSGSQPLGLSVPTQPNPSVIGAPPINAQQLSQPASQGGAVPMPPSPDQFVNIPPKPQVFGVQPIAGFGEAAAGIAGQKKAAEGRMGEVGKRQGENENLYRSAVSRMPQLEDTVGRLSKLGQAATYTNLGQLRDFTLRELGREMPDAATARAEYISMVDNEILPLLRDTFGAQFTQKEGESLKATLGNPNASPQEKDAVLRSFIRTKMQTLESLRREIDYGQSIPQYTPSTVAIGGQPFNPMGAAPQLTRQEIIDKLHAAGQPEELINAYLQSKGL